MRSWHEPELMYNCPSQRWAKELCHGLSNASENRETLGQMVRVVFLLWDSVKLGLHNGADMLILSGSHCLCGHRPC